MKTKMLFLILPSYTEVYSKSKISIAVPKLPLLSVALLAASARNSGAETRVLDLSVSGGDFKKALKETLLDFKPDYCLFGFTTPLYKEALDISIFIKKTSPQTQIICGGVHPSLFPEDILKNFPIDCVCVGEGENFVKKLAQDEKIENIEGAAYLKNNKFTLFKRKNFLSDLNSLPFPAWDLFDLKKYFYPKINVRKPPALPIMTSRGCCYNCSFCTKTIHGNVFRKMSPERVIEEIKYIKSMGANEFHIWDDQFTTDLNRAKEIASLLIKNNLKMPWNLFIGVRVDSIDKDFLALAKKSGLYQIAFAPESGSQKILDEIHKNIDLNQSIKAFKWCRELNIETVAFFVFGFLNETKDTINQTIRFASELNADYAKVTIALPLPKTEFYEKLKNDGLILSYDWTKYNFHTKHGVWKHPNLSWNELYSAYSKFYRKYYLRPSYLIHALKRTFKNKTFFYEVKSAFKTFTT